jgi:hypothetical protein
MINTEDEFSKREDPRRLCALTFLALYFGLIPAEEEFLSQKFQGEYEAYRRHVPRLLPRLSAWVAPGVVKTSFDQRAGLRRVPVRADSCRHLGGVPNDRRPTRREVNGP